MDWWITFDQQAADYLPDLRIEKEEPMDRHTSFRIGGPARRMAFPERGEQLVLLLDMAARCGARPLVMGNGTNLLAPDEGLDRLVIDTSAGLSRVEAGGTPGTILAEAVSGSVSAFVEEMNAEAQALGCENTHFVNPTGLHDPQHYTSAWDLSLIATEALKYPDFLTICDSIKEIIPATNLSSERVLRTTNYLLDTWRALGYRYRNAHGIKTGSTSDAGYCLVSSAEKGELRFLSVVMGCERVVDASGKADVKSFSETKRLFEWGFENFSYKTVQSVNDMLASIPVTLSQETNSVVLHPAEDVVVLLPNALSADDLKRVIRFERQSVEAPVQAGEVLAEAVLSYGDTEYAAIPLVALNDIDASRSLVLLAQVKAVLAKPIVKIAVILVVGLLLALLIWKLTIGRRRYRYGKNVRPSRNYKGRKRGF